MSNFIVGLSGGIGSGKTAVSDRFATRGITVVDADVIARQVVEPGSDALKAIQQHFGGAIVDANGELRRAELRKQIFSNAEDKQWLEALLHPLIATETLNQLEQAKSAYVIYVSPLLVEGGQKALCDRLLVIDVPESVQVARTMTRDDNDQAQVERIMASQASRQQRLDAADDVVDNSGDIEQLDAKVETLHQQYLAYAEEKKAQ
ncbi:dephospho-CoA kinase [Spongiibacter marinus]|uniref:dephospho-CoA kinase n=1 Tax=Spongiibacter marinus TaxID=354246 RepID=UPI003C419A85